MQVLGMLQAENCILDAISPSHTSGLLSYCLE